MKTLLIILGLIAGNFLYQYFEGADYFVVLERTFIQIFAVIAVRVVDWFNGD